MCAYRACGAGIKAGVACTAMRRDWAVIVKFDVDEQLAEKKHATGMRYD